MRPALHCRAHRSAARGIAERRRRTGHMERPDDHPGRHARDGARRVPAARPRRRQGARPALAHPARRRSPGPGVRPADAAAPGRAGHDGRRPGDLRPPGARRRAGRGGQVARGEPLDTLWGMCRRVQCTTCGRPTYAGCGNHVEQVLGDVAPSERCQCSATRAPARPTRAKRFWFRGRSDKELSR